MAVKTFTSTTLTASDTNTYLANSGLVYIKQQTIGTTVASVNVPSAFSADYDNYRITIGGGVGSTNISLNLKLGASTTGYYSIILYASFASPTVPASAGDNNGAALDRVGYAGTSYLSCSFDLFNPNKAQFTTVHNAAWIAPTVAGTTNGIHQVATAYTDFTITANVGTLTGGVITVYGYRKG